MSRLIDADRALEIVRDQGIAHPNAYHLTNYATLILREAPAVDAMEAVHAEWLDIVFDPVWRSMLATCSHCMVRGEVRVKSNECGFAVPDSDYCPHCGAIMDGGINK